MSCRSTGNAARQKKILSAKERILNIKKDILKIIEEMLEKEIKEEWFLKNCVKLCHADYDDVVQERNIEHLCGYPICQNTLIQTLKQKYHISQTSNKVYDLTERKCYCSNQCYKASNYLKAQLSPVPLYMRKEEVIKINLLSDAINRGSVGEEIIFHHKISEKEIDEVYKEEKITDNLSNILQEELKKCTDSIKDLTIKEHKFDNPQVSQPKASRCDSSISNTNDFESHSESESVDSDDSHDENLFPVYDNVPALSHRHMPILQTTKKTVLISPLNPNSNPKPPTEVLHLELVHSVIQDWLTEDSMKYLLGERQVYAAKAEFLFERMTTIDNVSPEKLAYIKNEYINLCLKIDKLPDDNDLCDTNDIDFVCKSDNSNFKTIPDRKKNFKGRSRKNSSVKKNNITISDSKCLQGEDELIVESKDKECMISDISNKDKSVDQKEVLASNSRELLTEKKIVKRSKKQVSFELKSQSNKKSNSSANNIEENPEDNKTSLLDEPVNDEATPEPIFPLVDSVAQNSLRKQVLIGRLKSVYMDILPIIGMHYTDIREGLRKLIDTLNLTPKNIMYKPKEWKLISIVLLRLLTKSVLKGLHNEVLFSKLCSHPVIPVKISVEEVEKLASVLLSVENLQAYSTQQEQ